MLHPCLQLQLYLFLYGVQGISSPAEDPFATASSFLEKKLSPPSSIEGCCTAAIPLTPAASPNPGLTMHEGHCDTKMLQHRDTCFATALVVLLNLMVHCRSAARCGHGQESARATLATWAAPVPSLARSARPHQPRCNSVLGRFSQFTPQASRGFSRPFHR